MTTLTKQPVSRSQIDQLDRKFASEVKKQLGYSVLESFQKESEFEVFLAEAGIQVYPTEEVEKYQSEKEKQSRSFWNSEAIKFVGLVFGVLLAALIAWNVASLVGYFEGLNPLPIVALLSLAVTSSVFVYVLYQVAHTPKKRYHWSRVRLYNYPRPVPEFALQTALDIRAKFPEGVTFFIDELVERETIDPFLVAITTNGKEYYLEYWNEPSFAKTRSV